MGCCHSKLGCADVNAVKCLKHEGVSNGPFPKREKGGLTKTSRGSSTIGAVKTMTGNSCCSNDNRTVSETSEVGDTRTSGCGSAAVPTAEEETDRDNTWPNVHEEETCQKEDGKTLSIDMNDNNNCAYEEIASVSDSIDDPTSSGRKDSDGEEEEDESNHVIAGLKASKLLYSLDDVTLHYMVTRMKREVVPDGTTIVKKGARPTESDCMYCVARGEVELHVSGGQNEEGRVTIHSRGWVFGEVALIFNSQRTGSVIAKGDCVLYALDRRSFVQIGMHVAQIRVVRFLRKQPLFKSVEDNKLIAFGRETRMMSCQIGTSMKLVNNHLYIVRKGKIRVTSVHHMGHDILGRGSAVRPDEGRLYDAMTDVEFIAIRLSAYRELGNADLSTQIAEERVLEILQVLGKDVDAEELDVEEIVKKHPPISVSWHESIVEYGQAIEHLYLVTRGEVKIKATENQPTNTNQKSNQATPPTLRLKRHNGAQYFGVDRNRKVISDVDVVVATSEVELLMIPHSLLTKPKSPTLRRTTASMRQTRHQLSQRIVEAFPKTYEGPSLRFQDLKQYRVVGEGEYGSVRLVVHPPTGRQYALKIMRKAAILDSKTAEHVIMERKMLVRLDGKKFLVGLRGAYQDEKSIYMLMDWVPGGELFSRIIGCGGRLPEAHAIFYAANVVLAYRQMHCQSIIYRDLKPENMLIDKNGYLKLADYGFTTMADGSAWTVCGTPDYQAPEIISRQGASKASDFWALGVLIYEMLTGDAPFKSPTDDRWDTHRRILAGRYKTPEYISPPAADLIDKLLQVDPKNRLGCWEGDLERVQTHPWFKRVDWKKVAQQKHPAPFLPALKDEMDTSCFDFYDSPTKCEAPAARHNFFDRDRPWSCLWEWIDEF